MENASKALIIAGAILLSILLISMGIIVYRNASSTINSAADMSETEIQTFNGKFTPYLGTNISANQVYSLCESVQTHNQTEKTNGTKRYIKVSITADTNKGIAATSYGVSGANVADGDVKSVNVTKLPSSQTYTVTASVYNGSIIQEITVKAN